MIEIHDEGAYRIDFLPGREGSRGVVFTFTEAGNRAVDGLGFGGAFLLSRGFGVVAFKCREDRWYQDLPGVVFPRIEACLAAHGASRGWRATYGSSMGGYAAVAFSGAVRADACFAISPQFDITWSHDTRWRAQAAKLGAFAPPSDCCLSDRCVYTIAYDPADPDWRHFDAFAALIPPERMNALPLRHSGHPSGAYLRQTGVLQELAVTALADPRAIMADKAEWVRRLRQGRRRSSKYLFGLGREAIRRRRFSIAADVCRAALAIDPLDAEVHIIMARALDGLRAPEQAVVHAAAASACKPENPWMLHSLANLLLKVGKPEQAMAHIERAVALRPEAPALLELRGRVGTALRRGQSTTASLRTVPEASLIST